MNARLGFYVTFWKIAVQSSIMVDVMRHRPKELNQRAIDMLIPRTGGKFNQRAVLWVVKGKLGIP